MAAGSSPSPAEIQQLLAGPALQPPPRYGVQFVNPPTLLPYLYTGVGLWIGIATVAVATRLATLLVFNRRIYLEDYFMILSWMAQVGESVCSLIIYTKGTGKHMWDITLRQFLNTQYYENLNSVHYALAVGFVKIAILLQIVRIFVPDKKMNRSLWWGCWIWIGITAVFYACHFTLELIQCVPRERIWNPFITDGFCLNGIQLFEATGLFNIFSDFAILLLPLPSIYKLSVPRKTKTAIACVFAAGLFACVTSIMRTVYTWRIINDPDSSWGVCFVAFWTDAEETVGTLVFCLPVFPRTYTLLKKKVQTVLSYTGYGSRLLSLEDLKAGRQEDGSPQVAEVVPAPGTVPEEEDKKSRLPYMSVSLASWEHPNQSRVGASSPV